MSGRILVSGPFGHRRGNCSTIPRREHPEPFTIFPTRRSRDLATVSFCISFSRFSTFGCGGRCGDVAPHRSTASTSGAGSAAKPARTFPLRVRRRGRRSRSSTQSPPRAARKTSAAVGQGLQTFAAFRSVTSRPRERVGHRRSFSLAPRVQPVLTLLTCRSSGRGEPLAERRCAMIDVPPPRWRPRQHHLSRAAAGRDDEPTRSGESTSRTSRRRSP